MGALDLSVELRSSAFDIGMADALIFNVPVELGLELMPVIGPDFPDAERELLDDVIDKVDRVGLCVFVVDFKCPDARRIVDGGILEAPDFLASITDKVEELNVRLDVVSRQLHAIALGVDFAHARSTRQATNAIAAQNACYACVGDCDAVITRQYQTILIDPR